MDLYNVCEAEPEAELAIASEGNLGVNAIELFLSANGRWLCPVVKLIVYGARVGSKSEGAAWHEKGEVAAENESSGVRTIARAPLLVPMLRARKRIHPNLAEQQSVHARKS